MTDNDILIFMINAFFITKKPCLLYPNQDNHQNHSFYREDKLDEHL